MRFKKNLDALNECLLVQIKWHIKNQFKAALLGITFTNGEKKSGTCYIIPESICCQ